MKYNHLNNLYLITVNQFQDISNLTSSNSSLINNLAFSSKKQN